MQTNTLKPVHARTTSARVGRGGKRGKTSGRGTKGQKARAGRKMRPEMRDLIKKIPKLRGHGKNRARTVRVDKKAYTPVSLASLEKTFAAGDMVTPGILLKKGVVSRVGGRAPKVKILATGALTKALSLTNCAASAGAKKAIESAGGSVL